CQPDDLAAHVQLAQAVCAYLETAEVAPTLADLSAQFHLSPAHLQRVFKRVMGVSPRAYYDAQRVAQFKANLKGGQAVTEALYDAGYNASSQLYPGALGMTPTAYKSGAQAIQIRYSSVPCSLGWLLVAATERGICALRLADTPAEFLAALKAEFPHADLTADEDGLGMWVGAVLAYLDAQPTALDALPLDIQATAFQRRVWEALRAIPYGSTRSYTEVAVAVGQPKAARAVAAACAANPVPLIVPCHRVVRGNGDLGGYSMGIERKRKLLITEGALVGTPELL
ncbi:MAG: methylated-DNA--[protein]-cysteine S-methyltransferase, partial [Armatimonadetes bacterium]|nr:methylated-DNA--[protein]-cysteine S-methyltransferase [Anaerolineae bacterium]